MLIALVPAVVCLVGLVVYLLAKEGKPAELGRLVFFVGLLWLVYVLAGKVVKLG